MSMLVMSLQRYKVYWQKNVTYVTPTSVRVETSVQINVLIRCLAKDIGHFCHEDEGEWVFF